MINLIYRDILTKIPYLKQVTKIFKYTEIYGKEISKEVGVELGREAMFNELQAQIKKGHPGFGAGRS